MNVLSASVSGNCVKQLRSKLSLAKKLGVPARRISSGFTLRNKISKTLSSSYVYTKRKVRTDALSDANKNLIHDFWCSSENSHPTGNKNDVKRVRIGPKKYSSHHVQILEKTQSEVYMDFKNKYPSVKVCQSLFERCKPYFVRAASTEDCVTCCCRYHLEMKHVFKAAMNNRKKCNQNLPSDRQFPVYASVTDMCNATLCNPNESGFHDKKCLDRNCPNCGVNKGNSPQDAAGGLIKNQTDLAIVRGRATIQNARDLFEFAKSNLSVPKSSHCKRRLFKYTENINRNFPMFYKPITGIRSVHQVVVNNDHLLIRSLSCYTCNNCLEGNINECENTNILGSFSPVPIVPEIGTVEVDQTDENDMEVPINELISKSTIFAVLCDDDDFDYYLLKAQTETYQLTSRETDSWGVSYQPGTKVIKGNYFMQGENPLHFKMIKRKYRLVPSNSCLYICTDVCVRNGEVKLSEDIHQNILKCVEMSTYVL
ncbi:unnamed protein product [Mytilus edulis]|uniref:Uncharacterized protein n=1 Tax=Mytilus edulis TaxID=6550 RepID=A0A8S3PTK6_MYTED|nr:unnamed protein product [Mytilus edulis]